MLHRHLFPKLFLLVVLLFTLYSFFKFQNSYSLNIHKLEQTVATLQTKFDSEEQTNKTLDRTIRLLQSDLENTKEKLAETIFFSKSQKQYKLLNNQLLLNHCCSFTQNGSQYLGFDLLVSDPPDSTNYYDFGTDSYIHFRQEDTIKNVSATSITGLAPKPIYKITIISEYKHTENYIYPGSDDKSNNYYGRLFEVKGDQADSLSFYTSIKPTPNGYHLTVKNAPNGKTTATYTLTKNGQGYSKETLPITN